MSSEFFIKKSDRLPILQVQFSDSAGYINLSGANVYFYYKFKPTGILNSGVAIVTDATNGIVQYAWTTGDVYLPGVFWCEWRATFSNGKQVSFPNDSYITFEISNNL
jgi:hypothetical protein